MKTKYDLGQNVCWFDPAEKCVQKGCIEGILISGKVHKDKNGGSLTVSEVETLYRVGGEAYPETMLYPSETLLRMEYHNLFK